MSLNRTTPTAVILRWVAAASPRRPKRRFRRKHLHQTDSSSDFSAPIFLPLIFLSAATALFLFGIGLPGLGAAEPEAPASPLKYEEPTFLKGAIFAQDSAGTNLLFRFERKATRSGETLNVQRDYLYPDGRVAARERIVYHGNDLTDYELQELQINAAGSATLRRDKEDPKRGTIRFEYRPGPAARTASNTEKLAPNTLVGDMVGPFLASHWDELAKGEKVKCRYLVVPRKETVGFTFVKDRESLYQGRPALLVTMEPSSALLSMLVDPLSFTIEKAPPHRVFQYLGRTTPRIQVNGKWKDLDALTVFDWATAR